MQITEYKNCLPISKLHSEALQSNDCVRYIIYMCGTKKNKEHMT